MKRSVFVVALSAVFALTLGSQAALAGNAHFIKSATTASLNGANLDVNFKEAGLESGSVETITVTADALTTYECVNNGGKNPSASNKTTTKSVASASGEFPADKNGNVSGELTLQPPSASDLGFTCPAGQTVTFVGVTYSNVKVTDMDTGASASIPGSFTYTNPSAP